MSFRCVRDIQSIRQPISFWYVVDTFRPSLPLGPVINTDAYNSPPLIAAFITLFRSAGDIAIQSVLALFALL